MPHDTQNDILTRKQRAAVELIRECNDEADDYVNELLAVIDELNEQFIKGGK